MRILRVVTLLLLALAPLESALAWDDDERIVYTVVANREEHLAIWPNDRERPLGWQDVGFTGTKADCLAYIDRVWTPFRPLSLRIRMQQLCLEEGGTPETCR